MRDKDKKSGQFLQGNKAALKHGGHSFAASGKVPSVKGVRKLKKDLEQLRTDLEKITPKMNVKKALIIGQICKAEGFILLIELYLKKAGILKPSRLKAGVIDVQPALGTTYLQLLNNQRSALALLGLDEQKFEEIKAPYEIVEDEK